MKQYQIVNDIHSLYDFLVCELNTHLRELSYHDVARLMVAVDPNAYWSMSYSQDSLVLRSEHIYPRFFQLLQNRFKSFKWEPKS